MAQVDIAFPPALRNKDYWDGAYKVEVSTHSSTNQMTLYIRPVKSDQWPLIITINNAHSVAIKLLKLCIKRKFQYWLLCLVIWPYQSLRKKVYLFNKRFKKNP